METAKKELAKIEGDINDITKHGLQGGDVSDMLILSEIYLLVVLCNNLTDVCEIRDVSLLVIPFNNLTRPWGLVNTTKENEELIDMTDFSALLTLVTRSTSGEF